VNSPLLFSSWVDRVPMYTEEGPPHPIQEGGVKENFL